MNSYRQANCQLVIRQTKRKMLNVGKTTNNAYALCLIRSTEPSGSGSSFRPGTWQPPTWQTNHHTTLGYSPTHLEAHVIQAHQLILLLQTEAISEAHVIQAHQLILVLQTEAINQYSKHLPCDRLNILSCKFWR